MLLIHQVFMLIFVGQAVIRGTDKKMFAWKTERLLQIMSVFAKMGAEIFRDVSADNWNGVSTFEVIIPAVALINLWAYILYVYI